MEQELKALNAHLASKRLKKTQQRETILEVFLESKKHVTVEELHNLVKYRDASIGLTTVYRTMKLLCDCNIARANHFEEGKVRYELQRDHHDHMICLKCGETIEFVNESIETLQQTVAEEHGFDMVHHRMEIFGYCADCRKGKGSRSSYEIL